MQITWAVAADDSFRRQLLKGGAASETLRSSELLLVQLRQSFTCVPLVSSFSFINIKSSSRMSWLQIFLLVSLVIVCSASAGPEETSSDAAPNEQESMPIIRPKRGSTSWSGWGTGYRPWSGWGSGWSTGNYRPWGGWSSGWGTGYSSPWSGWGSGLSSGWGSGWGSGLGSGWGSGWSTGFSRPWGGWGSGWSSGYARPWSSGWGSYTYG
ncbi:hypothetical protein TELCIR_10090 [Teladorsagia circumcincta]|uniref:Uncharacterized protein n=1 Tax=Teladorsagia circumcincta TaxID=45464 RepID=A0A2G9UD24_TELCI|nr:hypothetical protein TELCIR_10090 [Teladorsagia circumcincta]